MGQKLQEMVLYYQADEKENADKEKNVRLMKSVLVRMGVRIKNIGNDQIEEKVGYLAGINGYSPRCLKTEINLDASGSEASENKLPALSQDVLVMKNFTSKRIDVLLAGLKKAGVPKIALKAVITPQNADWSFYQLYQELLKEHETLQR